MAWGGSTPTLLDDAVETSFDADVVTASVSPTGDALLIAVTHARRAGGNTGVSGFTTGFSISGSWTQRAASQYTGGSQNPVVEIWTATAAASPGSGTLTANFDTACPMRAIALVEVASGWDSETPEQSDTGTATTTTSPSDSFASAPGADNLLISALSAYATTTGLLTEDSGWTELSEDGTSTQYKHVQWSSGSNGNSYSWSGLNASVTEQVYAAIEIGAASSGVTGSGAPAAQAAAADGTAERELPGSGTPAAQAADADGTGERVLTCSGTLTSAASSVDGTASLQLKVELTAATGRELRDEDGALVASLANIAYEWYDKDTDTTGNPDFSGTLSTNASGEATIQLPGTALASGQYGLLVLEHPSDNTIRGIYRIPVT